MIMESEEYFSKRKYFRMFKSKIKNEVVKLAVLVLACVIVAAAMGKRTEETSYTFYYAQSKVVNKHTRGVFPPLEGRSHEIYGVWDIAARIGQTSFEMDEFKNYLIEFDKGNRIFITKKETECEASRNLLVYKWNVYSYNMFISDVPPELQAKLLYNRLNNITEIEDEEEGESHLTSEDEERYIGVGRSTQEIANITEDDEENPENISQAEKNVSPSEGIPLESANPDDEMGNSTDNVPEIEVDCFADSEEIISHLRSFTIWTMREGDLYLISEPITNGTLDVSIFVLKKRS